MLMVMLLLLLVLLLVLLKVACSLWQYASRLLVLVLVRERGKKWNRPWPLLPCDFLVLAPRHKHFGHVVLVVA